MTNRPGGKKDAVLAAALRLFTERGVEAVTVRDIAEAAGIAEATFYRYYPGRDELVQEVFMGQVLGLVLELDELQARHDRCRDKLRAVIGRFYGFFDDHSALISFLLLGQNNLLKAKDGVRRPTNVIMWILEQGQSRGEIREGPLKVLSAMALGAILLVPISRIYGSVRGPLRPHIDEVADGLWRMLAPDGGT